MGPRRCSTSPPRTGAELVWATSWEHVANRTVGITDDHLEAVAAAFEPSRP